ncbi:MAG: potassium/hydrogen antiporter [Solirubrobacteraceae bacterium]|nr:potassium/hydrogen antiporter [Solirubrobacteraceae bacterium]
MTWVHEGQLMLITGVLLAAGLAASLAAGRLRMPGLVLVLGLGMLIGSDGLGWIDFGDFTLARQVGIVALAMILFEGGLTSGFDEIRPVLGTSIALATLGTLGTALLTAVAAGLIFHLELLPALLLGSTVAATDAAAVFAVLRGSTLPRRLARTLEGESGVNDPIAILLVIGCIQAIQDPSFGIGDALLLVVRELGIGFACGMVVGFASAYWLRVVRLPSAGLYPVASVATAALAYGLADTLHGSGFLAVYLAGLVLGTVSTPARRTIVTFHEGLAWVAQLALFLVLGLLVFPGDLGAIALEGTAIALATALIARPLAALAVTAFSGFTVGERLVLGWAGLRGAVPVVFATFAVTEHVPDGMLFFNVAFFVVLLSTVLQGTTIQPVAKLLGASADEAAIPEPLVEPVLLSRLGAEVIQYPVRDGDAVVGHAVRELGLPREALLNVVVRGDRAIPPRGSTVVEAGDQLHVIVRQEAAIEFRDLLRRWREGPLGPRERPRPRPRSRPSVTTVRPWQETDGDPSRPEAVAGRDVVDQLRTRRDEPGALVLLDDGRYAVTGPLLAIGPAGELQAVVRRRLNRAESSGERAWWREVAGALAR